MRGARAESMPIRGCDSPGDFSTATCRDRMAASRNSRFWAVGGVTASARGRETITFMLTR